MIHFRPIFRPAPTGAPLADAPRTGVPIAARLSSRNGGPVSHRHARRWAALFLLLSAGARLAAADYYVSTFGTNAKTCPGTLAQPFQTITYASSRSAPGDTIHIRSGTYRETVNVLISGTASAPIVFKPYNGETVIISALDPIVPATGATWQQHSGNIYKIQLTSANGMPTPSASQNAVFCDGALVGEARWPNVSNPMSIDCRVMASADSGTVDLAKGPDAEGKYTGTFFDSDLASFPANAWKGATLRGVTSRHWWQIATTVTSSTAGSLVFQYSYDPNKYDWDIPSNGDRYFLFGRLAALDSANEAFFDDAGRDGPQYTLYLWKKGGGSPAANRIELKKRTYCINVSARSWIRFENVRLLGGAIICTSQTTEKPATSNCTFDQIRVDYGMLYWSNPHSPAVTLSGSANQLLNSTVNFSTGNGVALKGTNHTVRNCVIHDSGNQGLMTTTISATVPSTGLTVEHNTVYNSGATGLSIHAAASKFRYNHVYNAGLIISDIACMNAWGTGDLLGTEVAWNWVHDNKALYDPTRQWNGGLGIRYDSGGAELGCYNYSIHHNIIWNTDRGALSLWSLLDSQVGSGNARIRAYNNTCGARIHISEPLGNAAGIDIRNNIATLFMTYGASLDDVTLKNNLFITTPFDSNLSGDPGFISAVNRNYQLTATSPARDAGVAIPPFTDGYSGTAPDLGAIEYGTKPFTAGALVCASDLAPLAVRYSPTLDNQPRFLVTGLPPGRSLPPTAKLKIGSASASGTFTHQYDFATHRATAVFTGINTSTLFGTQNATLALDGTKFESIGSVSIAPAPLASGRFNGHASYLAPLTLTGAAPGDLADNPVPIRLDTAALIAAGLMRSDASDLIFLTNDGAVRLNYWIESGLGTAKTIIWLKLPAGKDLGFSYNNENRLWVGYGSPLEKTVSNRGAIFPELVLGSFKLWLKADTITGLASGSTVSTWYDRSGAGNHATQPDTNLRPTYQANPSGGFAAVRFDGLTTATTGDVMTIGDKLGQSACEFLCVYTNPSPGTMNYQRLLSAAQAPDLDHLAGAAIAVAYEDSGVSIPHRTPTIATFSTSTTRDLRSMAIGRHNNNAYHWFRGDLMEVLGFTQRLDTLQRANVLFYLNRKFALVPGASGTVALGSALPVIDHDETWITFSDWATANFTAAERANAAISGPDADPDRCGLSNLARYAFDLPARGRVTPPITLTTTGAGSAQRLSLTFPRKGYASGLQYSVQSSPDLVTWSNLQTIQPDYPKTFTFTDTVSIGSAPRRFLRVRVTQQ